MSASDVLASVPAEGAEVPATAAGDAAAAPHSAPHAEGAPRSADAAPDDPFPLLAIRRRTEL